MRWWAVCCNRQSAYLCALANIAGRVDKADFNGFWIDVPCCLEEKSFPRKHLISPRGTLGLDTANCVPESKTTQFNSLSQTVASCQWQVEFRAAITNHPLVPNATNLVPK